MKKIALLVLPALFLFNACALEIANVIGPRGGWVFYDKGNYKDKWRYKECAPNYLVKLDISNYTDDTALIKEALKKCYEASNDYNVYGWEIPNEHEMRSMLESFSYGLTRFSSDVYFLSVNKVDWVELSPVDIENPSDYNKWKVVVYHLDFSGNAFGTPAVVNNYKGVVELRPFGRF